MSEATCVLGVAGSLRAGSLNRSLLRAAVELVPAGMEIRTFEGLGEIPPYNADVEAAGDAAPVAAWKDAIRKADALLFVTPEYNYGVPGVLKNAFDWASRPPGKSPLSRKPAGIMGVSGGTAGPRGRSSPSVSRSCSPRLTGCCGRRSSCRGAPKSSTRRGA